MSIWIDSIVEYAKWQENLRIKETSDESHARCDEIAPTTEDFKNRAKINWIFIFFQQNNKHWTAIVWKKCPNQMAI